MNLTEYYLYKQADKVNNKKKEKDEPSIGGKLQSIEFPTQTSSIV